MPEQTPGQKIAELIDRIASTRISLSERDELDVSYDMLEARMKHAKAELAAMLDEPGATESDAVIAAVVRERQRIIDRIDSHLKEASDKSAKGATSERPYWLGVNTGYLGAITIINQHGSNAGASEGTDETTAP